MTQPPTAPFTCNARHHLVTNQAINVLTIQEKCTPNPLFTHQSLKPCHNTSVPNLKHYANPMVYPVTGKVISSYKKAINDHCIAEVWKTAFGKEFGGLAQGDNKTNTVGTNAILVMSHDDIRRHKGQKYTYARIVLDHRPQKEEPNCIRITAGGNLIKCNDKLLVRSANITTAK